MSNAERCMLHIGRLMSLWEILPLATVWHDGNEWSYLDTLKMKQNGKKWVGKKSGKSECEMYTRIRLKKQRRYMSTSVYLRQMFQVEIFSSTLYIASDPYRAERDWQQSVCSAIRTDPRTAILSTTLYGHAVGARLSWVSRTDPIEWSYAADRWKCPADSKFSKLFGQDSPEAVNPSYLQKIPSSQFLYLVKENY
jgi:hypothetical protein